MTDSYATTLFQQLKGISLIWTVILEALRV
jgi:hypothetical protein